MIIEPVQAEGGIHLPPPGFLQDLRRHCTETGTVLIFDEVQTGAGRTGTFYAFEKERVVPDIISLAKGLGGGIPIGAILATGEVAKGFEPGTHASTFGGNPFATAAALYVQEAIDRLGLLERCREAGAYLGNALTAAGGAAAPADARRARPRPVAGPRSLDGDATPLVNKARELGLLVSAVGGNVVRLVPALTVGKAEIDEAIELLDRALADV